MSNRFHGQIRGSLRDASRQRVIFLHPPMPSIDQSTCDQAHTQCSMTPRGTPDATADRLSPDTVSGSSRPSISQSFFNQQFIKDQWTPGWGPLFTCSVSAGHHYMSPPVASASKNRPVLPRNSLLITLFHSVAELSPAESYSFIFAKLTTPAESHSYMFTGGGGTHMPSTNCGRHRLLTTNYQLRRDYCVAGPCVLLSAVLNGRGVPTFRGRHRKGPKPWQ